MSDISTTTSYWRREAPYPLDQKTSDACEQGDRMSRKDSVVNERRATGVTHIACWPDGLTHLATEINCHDQEGIDDEFCSPGSSQAAEWEV